MAQATRLPKTVTVFTGVELILSEDEANTLFKVCSRIGGDLHNSRRRHMQSIIEALLAAGYSRANALYDAEGNIYFE